MLAGCGDGAESGVTGAGGEGAGLAGTGGDTSTGGTAPAGGGGGSGDEELPTATLTRTDTIDPVVPGISITLAWTSTGANACTGTADAANPTDTGWDGPKPLSSSGTDVVVAAVGTYTFHLVCENESGSSGEQTVSVVVQAAAYDCTDPLISPSSMTRIDKTWVQAFSAPNGFVTGTYPVSVPGPVPIGSEKGHYTVIPFTPNAAENVSITFDMAQANNQYGYGQPRVTNGGMFVSISPCAGDLRAIDNGTTDDFLRSSCRIWNNAGGLTYSTVPGSPTICRLEAGVPYFITVSPVDPSDGITAGEETCLNDSFTGCDVQAISRAL